VYYRQKVKFSHGNCEVQKPPIPDFPFWGL
jgi:hypothetical protein